MDVTGDQKDGQETQTTDSNATQFGGMVSPTSTFTKDVEAEIAKQVRQAETRIGQSWRERFNEKEQELYKDDPDGLKVVRERQRMESEKEEADRLKREAEAQKNEAQSMLNQAKTIIATNKAEVLAAKYGVDAQKLLSYSGSNVDMMEDLAKDLAGVKPPETAETQQKQILNPDNNETAGGGDLSLENLLKIDTKGMSPKELREHKSKIEEKSRNLKLINV